MSQKLHRRTILQSIVAVAATTAFGCSDETTPTIQSEQSPEYFPQSVASGDPRPDSVVLWTRAYDEKNSGDIALALEVATDANFTQLVLQKQDGLTALAAHDNVIRVKVTNLSPRTTYYYRFAYKLDGQTFYSPVGRTKTAPAAGDDVPVKFVVGNCQDYVGRYYNAWQHLLQLGDNDVDAILFIGDYIYETTGDPTFQSTNTLRGITFTEPDKALVQKSGFFSYQAANSLSNYRDIYKTIRSDPTLQKVHERYPFIVVWDDHEFSDDCWGATATYEDGRHPENEPDRRRNAEQAFFEFHAIDSSATAPAGPISVDSEPRYPDTRIYRDFEYGKHVRLIVTDYRTYRPDHLIPEDAYPGTVVMDEPTLSAIGALQGPLTTETFTYVNVDAPELATLKGALHQAYVGQAVQAGLTPQEASEKADFWVKGNLALAYVNQVLAALGQQAISPEGKPHGVAYVHMGKVGLFDLRGSRYVVVKDTFDVYAQYHYLATSKASENVYGATQEAWFQEKVQTPNTWKVVVSSVSFSSLVWDLSQKTEIPDPTLRQRFYFNVDHWDGFPTKKRELLGSLKTNNVNALILSGDIHASYASVEGGIPALTGPGISSGTVQELAGTAVVGAGYSQGSAIYQYAVAQMDATLKAGNSGLVFANSSSHGFLMVEINAEQAVASYHLIPSSEINKDYSKRKAEELEEKFTTEKFIVKDGAITKA